MDAVFNHVLDKIHVSPSEKTLNDLHRYIKENEYDSDALMQDLEGIFIEANVNQKLNQTKSNLYLVCDDTKYITYFKDYIRYNNCKCMLSSNINFNGIPQISALKHT